MLDLLYAEGFNLFGELCAQPSRLAPDCAMDPAVGQLVASGLASAATLLCASLLRTAFKCALNCNYAQMQALSKSCTLYAWPRAHDHMD